MIVGPRIEAKRSRYTDASPAVLLGMLHDELLADHAEALVRGMVAGFERPKVNDLRPDDDWRDNERVPEWHVKSITIDGEEHASSPGNGVTMTEVDTEVESWVESRDHEEDWRLDPWSDPSCNRCDAGEYSLGVCLDASKSG